MNDAGLSARKKKTIADNLSNFFRWIGRVAAGAVFVIALFLIYVYASIGDLTVFGETITIRPPLVWMAPLMTLFVFIIFSRSWRVVAVAGSSIVALMLWTEDWDSLKTAKPTMERKVGTRIVTWNIAGRTDWPQLLEELKPWKPDIVFLQETPDGNASLTTESLSGFWKGFDWMDQGDCGILSRYPLTHLSSPKIGPWDKPAMATAVIPKIDLTTRTVLLCNVRLMLPAAATSPDRWFDDPVYMQNAHETRIQQYKNLAELLSTTSLTLETEAVLLGGDFNCRGGSKSLIPLETAGLRDVWPVSGGGWGATVLADFPMARIDHIWVSNKWLPMHSRTAVGSVSDHRMVISDLVLN